MVVMKYFCFYFPVRLGVIIASVFSSLQSVIVIIYALIHDTAYLKENIEEIQKNIDSYSSNEFFEKFLRLAAECEWIMSNISKLLLYRIVFDKLFIKKVCLFFKK